MPNCTNCTEECPQAETAKEIAIGRMYATKELCRMIADIEGGRLVEVVRCGKCKHWKPYGRDFVLKKDYGRCEKPDNESLIKYNASPYEDWYCADGERKGGDE